MSTAVVDGDTSIDLQLALEQLAELPFHHPPFSARNWGHPMHSLCSYPSRLKASIASTLVRLFSTEGEIVLDPFCGIGTIPFEAALQGRRSIANDINPVGAIVSDAKLRPTDTTSLSDLLRRLERALVRPSLDEEPDPELRTFYHERTLEEIDVARRFLERERSVGNPAAPLATAAMLHLLHGNRPYALSRRSHNIIPIPPKGPVEYKPVIAHLRAKLARQRHPLPDTFRSGSTFQADARELRTLIPAVDAVITSPPFLGTTEFIRQNRVRLWFAGWNYERQRVERARFFEHRKDRAVAVEEIARTMVELIRPGGVLVLHLGVVRGFDMARTISDAAIPKLGHVGTVYEDASHLESHGRTDRGGTAKHAYAVFRRTD